MWNKCGVVMLPTNQKATLKSDLAINEHNLLFQPSKLEGTWFFLNMYQHLYIISDEKIRDGDWCINLAHKLVVKPTDMERANFNSDNLKKIIATTRTISEQVMYYPDGTIIGRLESYKILPQIPEPFVEYFVMEYEKGNIITDAMVEYKFNNDSEAGLPEFGGYDSPGEYLIKINPDNTINIKPIKDSWNKREVQNLLFMLKDTMCLKYDIPNDEGFTSFKELDAWINKNLK